MNTRDLFKIYFIKPVGMDGPIKIGISAKPDARCKEFGSWSPFPLEVIGTVWGRWADEQFLHECLSEYHSHGEWFHAAPLVLETVETVLSDGGFERIREKLNPVGNIRSKKNRLTRAFGIGTSIYRVGASR